MTQETTIKPAILKRDITRAYQLYVMEGHYKMMCRKRMLEIFHAMRLHFMESPTDAQITKIESLIAIIAKEKMIHEN